MGSQAICALLLAPLCFADPREVSSDALTALWDSRHWFALRDAVQDAAPQPHVFYRGAVACAFQDAGNCERDFKRLFKTGPAEASPDGHDFLVALYMREGRSRRALAHRDEFLRLQGNAGKRDSLRNLLAAFSTYPDMTVLSRHASTVQGEFNYGHLFVPVSIHGRHATYILDTGANFSAITESEAKRLDLRVAELDVDPKQIGEASGKGVAKPKYAVVDRLDLGAVHLKNVPFLVESDEPEAFSMLPSGYRGAIGIQVLLACRKIRWDAHAAIQVDLDPGPKNVRGATLCFNGLDTFIQAGVEGGVLDLQLDTGADGSSLLQRFAKSYPEIVKLSGRSGTVYQGGAGGSAEVQATILPEIKFRFGAFGAVLKPANIIAREVESDAVIGMDILRQAREVTLDFQAMKFILSQ